MKKLDYWSIDKARDRCCGQAVVAGGEDDSGAAQASRVFVPQAIKR